MRYFASMSLGDRIRTRLQAIRMTQAELCRRSGVPQSTLNSILQRDTRSTPHLVRLARALRTSPAYLLGETDDPDSDMAEAALSFEERELVSMTRQLEQADYEAVRHIIEALARAGAARCREEGRERVGTLHDPQLGYRAG